MTGRHASAAPTDDDPLRGTALTYDDVVHETHHAPRHLETHDTRPRRPRVTTSGYVEEGGSSWSGSDS